MNAHTAQIDDLRLIALPTAVKCADLFVRFTLTEWSLRAMMDQAASAACQLAAAIVDGTDSRSPGFFTLRLRLRGGCLTVEAEAEQPTPLVNLPATVVDRPTEVIRLSGGTTLVRCELPLPGGLTATAVPLPRRERKRAATEQPAPQDVSLDSPEMDPQLMQRILFQLGRSAGDQAQ